MSVMPAAAPIPAHVGSRIVATIATAAVFAIGVVALLAYKAGQAEPALTTRTAIIAALGAAAALAGFAWLARRATQPIAQLEAAATALKAAEAEARKLALVARHTHNGVLITSRDRRIVWVNEAFTRITCYASEEVIGGFTDKFLHGPET